MPLTLGATVGAIALPIQGSSVPYGDCTVSGWARAREMASYADILHVVTKPNISNVECNRGYGGRITPDMMCPGKPGLDACQGDDGGPMTVNDV